MEFNSKKFEQIIHGSTKDVSVDPYKSSSEDPITIKNTVKDLGVFSTRGRYQFTIPTRGVPTCIFRKIKNVPPPPHFGIDTNLFWPIFKKKAYPPPSLYDTNRLLLNHFCRKKTYPPLKLKLNFT